MGNYCDAEDIGVYLSTTFNTESTPTELQVEDMITRFEDEIDTTIQTSFVLGEVTNLIMDFTRFDSSLRSNTGYNLNLYPQTRADSWGVGCSNSMKLDHEYIGTIQVEQNLANLGSADNWSTLTEGSGEDYVMYKDEGIIVYPNTSISEGLRRFRFNYSYQKSTTVPPMIQRLCILLTSKEVIRTKQLESNFSSADNITIESISITKASSNNVAFMNSLQDEIDRLYDKVGVLKTWLI